MTATASLAPTPVADLSRPKALAMAVACGAAVANIYYNQPMLAAMQAEFPGSSAMPFVATATQVGYALGLFFTVPLGDRLERRRLIVVQFLVLAAALVALALAPSPLLVLAASVLVGLTATVAQQIVPLAAHLAAPQRRGIAVGTVMAGLLCGILLSRTAAGFVATHWGWHAMFWLSAPVALAMAALMAAVLPESRPDPGSPRYPQLIASLGRLWVELPELRRASLAQSLTFATFTVFWTTLVFYLAEPPFGLGADVAGLFGVIGLVGVLAAPLAGRIADRSGPMRVIALGIALTLLSWGIFWISPTLVALTVGVVLLDFGVQSAMVSNQHSIYALRPEARGRVNTVYMTLLFVGGAIGAAAAATVWHAWGWAGTCVLGACFSAASLAVHLLLSRRPA